MRTLGRVRRAFEPLLVAVLLGGCGRGAGPRDQGPLRITLSVEGIGPHGLMQPELTCDGPGISPGLSWSGVPAGAKSLALVVDDPDAPGGTWVHWVLYDLPPATSSLGAAIRQLPADTREGRNDWKRTGYGAPCPPNGTHRYVHTLYALDRLLPDLHQPTAAQLREAMRGHVLARGQVVGRYTRDGR